MDNIVSTSICVDNSAFGDTYDSQAYELARIFRSLADRVESCPAILDPMNGPVVQIYDLNGNVVGAMRVHKE